MTASLVRHGRHESHKPMKKQTVAFSVMPAVPWGTEERCMVLEAGFARQLLGLCGVLTLYRMWDGTDEEIAIVQAQVEKGIAALMGCGCNDDAIVSIKQSKGGYMVATDVDGNETRLQSVYNNSTWELMPETQLTDNTNAKICSGVRMLVTRLLEDILFSLDQAQLTADSGQAIAQGISAMVDLVTLGAFPLEDVYDGAQEFFFTTAELGISSLKVVFNDPDVREQWVENMYCAIVNSTPKVLTDDIYLSSIDGLPLGSSQSTILEFFLRAFSALGEPNWDRIYKLYNLGALSEDPTCAAEFGCEPSWCYEWDFTVSDGGWAYFPESPDVDEVCNVYVPGVGWQSTFADADYRLRIDMHGGENVIYTGFEVEFSSGGAIEFLVLGFSDGERGTYLSNQTPLISEVSGAISPATWEGEHGDDRRIILDFVSDGSSRTVTKIKVYGTGDVPWGDPNCE